jgi:hypothetical protein
VEALDPPGRGTEEASDIRGWPEGGRLERDGKKWQLGSLY